MQGLNSPHRSILRTGFQNMGLFKNLTTGGAVMKGIFFMLAGLMAFSVGLYGQEALTIDDITEMVEANLRSRTIVQKVNLSSMQYAPSVDDIVRLKKAGASRRVIEAVLAAPVTGPSEIPATSSTKPSPEPWTTSSTMATPKPEATSPEPRSGGLEEGDYPKIELFGGYNFVRAITGSTNLHGVNVAMSGNINETFGVVLDHSSIFGDSFGISVKAFTLMAGPQFSIRTDTVTAFFRVLVGLVHESDNISGFPFFNDTALAVAGGGGLDVNVADHLAIRAVQVDYLYDRLGGFNSNNLRLGFGVVGRW